MSGRHPWPPPRQQHASDCAVHNEPALPRGECNCSPERGQRLKEIAELLRPDDSRLRTVNPHPAEVFALLQAGRYLLSLVGDLQASNTGLLGAVERLNEQKDRLRRENADLNLLIDTEALLAANDRVAALTQALQRIADNADSWHGPPPEDSGHVKALAVIAGWARAVLSSASEPTR